MNIKHLITIIAFFLLAASCQTTQRYIDREQDKRSVDDLVDKFFSYQKQKKYDSMSKLFTLGNSGMSEQDLHGKLLAIFRDTEIKNGEVVRTLSRSSHTEVTVRGMDSIGVYEAAVESERMLNISRETFKMMLEKGELKIYDYQIAVKNK